ncbi:hypothetical protein HWD99_12215 [Microbacterium sp. C5A9]|uniref:hypothetical protein n=1 Tax=Microbacterium sp. C5A9 TaxID=2736663 RepID=UPI001F520A7F|nr:hypothetical protein [Microbacterium sp. C5A9]MCI1019392.1 hypothetical protein [Microbacterium sp. C5A9]
MTTPTGNQSRRLNESLRSLTAYYLSSEGFDAEPSPIHSKISTALDAGLVPDVTGIPGVWVDVSARGNHRLSTDLDSARATAAMAGYPVTALVQTRGGRGIDEAFAVLTLSGLAKLARAAASTP